MEHLQQLRRVNMEERRRHAREVQQQQLQIQTYGLSHAAEVPVPSSPPQQVVVMPREQAPTPMEAVPPAPAPAPARETPLVVYDGDEYHCSLCIEDFEDRDRVIRLSCRHIFHAACWNNMGLAENQSCPNCRAAGDIVAIWNFIGPRSDLTQGQPNLLNVGNVAGTVDLHPIQTPREMLTDYEFGTPGSEAMDTFATFACSDADARSWDTGLTLSTGRGVGITTSSQQTYISNTELSDGRQALLIDPGSWGNLTGTPWARRTAMLASRHGLRAKQTLRERPLNVSGVGRGAQTCTHDCDLPIALRTVDDRVITGVYRTPTLNENALPALLGLKTLLERRAILDFGRMQCVFTGPGETQIDYSPGSDIFKMIQAPSGHLMLPCCEYQTPGRSSTEPEATLHTDSAQTRPEVRAEPETSD